MSLNTTILSVTRRTVRGFTVGEIFDRVANKLIDAGSAVPAYSTVRARVYELANSGQLNHVSNRRDRITGRNASTFVRNF